MMDPPLLDAPRGEGAPDPSGPSGFAAVADPASRRRGRQVQGPPWWLLLLLGWLGQAALRFWLASGQTMPVATPDETGYLLAARVLTGGPDADLSPSTVYRGGYPLLLTPAFWLADNPETVYRLAIAVNALVGATVVLLVYQVLRRLALSRRWSYAVAHVTALLPATVFYTQYVLTDAVLPAVLLCWLLLLHSWLLGDAGPKRSASAGIGAGLAAAYADAVHVRGTVVVTVCAAIFLLAAVFRWRPRWSAALAGLALVVGVAAGRMLNGWLQPHLYPRGANDLPAYFMQRLTSIDGYVWTLSVGVGQIWYLIVATGGLAGIGIAAVAAAAFRRGTDPRMRALAVGLLVAVLGIAFATSAGLPDEYRVGNYAYGRYLACLTPVFFAVGVAVLPRRRGRVVLGVGAAVAVTTFAAAWIVQANAGVKLRSYVYLAFDFPETAFLTWDWTTFRLWPATVAGLLLLALALAVSRIGRRGPVLVVAGLALVNLAMVTTAADRISRPLVRNFSAATDLHRAVIPGTSPRVAIDFNVAWKLRLPQLYEVWWSQVRGYDSRWQQPPADADIVVVYWHRGTPAASSWPNAPAGWQVADSRGSAEGNWVAWRRTSG